MAERSGKRKMSKREGQDESLRLRDEELCVAAAFLEIPCLYGVSDRFFRRGAGSLEGRVLDVCGVLEMEEWILIEPGGTVRMQLELYRALVCMGRPNVVVRLFADGTQGRRRLYLYGREASVYARRPDEKGGGEIRRIGSYEELISFAQFNQGEESGGLKCCGALMLARQGSLYETEADLVWRADENDAEELTDILHTLWAVLLKDSGKEETGDEAYHCNHIG